MSSKAVQGIGQPRDSTKKAILAAAYELVGDVGYTRLTMDAIASRAKVGKQTIYRWWPSKGAVLLDAFLMLSEGSGSTPATLPDTGDLEADLRVILHASVLEFADPRFEIPLRALTTAILHDEELAAVYNVRLERPIREMKRERLRAAQRSGEIADDVDLDAVIDALFSPLAQRWLLRTGPLTTEYVDQVVRTVVHGIRS